MYILVKEEDIKNAQLRGMFHERMPDGRLIMPISELKMLGSVENCQIVASAKELKELISSGAESIAPGGGVQDNDNVPDTGEDIGAGGNDEEAPDVPETEGGTEGTTDGQPEGTDGGEDAEGVTDNGTAVDGGENDTETESSAEDTVDGQAEETHIQENFNESEEE